MEEVAPQDYSKDATGVFFSMRLAALFPAGATFGSAFAMLPSTTDAFLPSMLKRLHLIVAIASVCNSLVAVAMSTVAINRLAFRQAPLTANLAELLKREYDFLWCGCNAHFTFSLVGLLAMVGIRSYAAFSCPYYGRIGALTVFTALVFMTSIICEMLPEDEEGREVSVARDALVRYPTLMVERMRRGSHLTTLAALLVATCFLWTVEGFRHVYLALYASR